MLFEKFITHLGEKTHGFNRGMIARFSSNNVYIANIYIV